MPQVSSGCVRALVGGWGGGGGNEVAMLLNSKMSHLPLTWSIVVRLLDAVRKNMMVNDV